MDHSSHVMPWCRTKGQNGPCPLQIIGGAREAGTEGMKGKWDISSGYGPWGGARLPGKRTRQCTGRGTGGVTGVPPENQREKGQSVVCARAVCPAEFYGSYAPWFGCFSGPFAVACSHVVWWSTELPRRPIFLDIFVVFDTVLFVYSAGKCSESTR